MGHPWRHVLFNVATTWGLGAGISGKVEGTNMIFEIIILFSHNLYDILQSNFPDCQKFFAIDEEDGEIH